MRIISILFAALIAQFALAPAAHADPADIDAAARGVVRVVLVGAEGEEVFPVSHGSGFAVAPNQIITNAHVIREALQDDTLRTGIVPSEGAEAAYGRPIAVSPRNDLALIEIIDGDLALPPLTISGGVTRNLGEVTSVGYPMNVDLAQGLDLDDIFQSQPPVKSRGFLSGERPSRQFDTILHTAPIARGNSGGPLLDGCGRVLGVNSFGADSDGSDAEFYFAVSLRELLPFLRENNVDPRTSALPCRSIEELNAAERIRFDAQRRDAREKIAAREADLLQRRNEARFEAQLAVMSERENAMALAMIGLLLTLGAGFVALQSRQKDGGEARTMIAAAIGGASLIGTVLVWVNRPGINEIEERVAQALEGQTDSGQTPPESLAGDGTMLCTLVPERSRVTGARTDDVEFTWAADGCVNGRTQYAMRDGDWQRVLAPDDEAVIELHTYDPRTQTFQRDRYLLGRSQLATAREARAKYDPPSCGIADAARILGDQQAGVKSLLPNRPNERLVYSCELRINPPGGGAGDQ